MEASLWRLAIDFGTSNTAAAVVQGHGGVHVLRLGARSDAMPSCVAAYKGEIQTGDGALQIAGIYPAAFEPTPKRRLGEEAVVLAGSLYDPVDLVAAILRFVVAQATRFVGGGSPAQVVLTHPEAWDEFMKDRLIAAARQAGIPLQSIALLPEPVAAGWHYAAGSNVGIGAHVAVLDFGGGTCDAAVLELAQTPAGPAFRVVASGGIDPLGGHDFDAQLENWVYAQLAAEGKDVLLQSLKSERRADRTLRDQVREAKHALSFHGSAPIGVRSGENEWVCTITRREFEQLIERQLDQAVDLVQRVIHEALPSAQQLHRVYLTGGSSHIPALQEKLGDILPMKLGLMGDPKQITSFGALEAPEFSPQPADVSTKVKSETRTDLKRSGVEDDQRGDDRKQPDRPVGNEPKPQRERKKMLIGVSAGAAVLLAGATIALATFLRPGPPTPTPTSDTPSPPTRNCAGAERPHLSDGECDLITKATTRLNLILVDPDTCVRVGAKQLSRASYGLECNPVESWGFTSSDEVIVGVYGYKSVAALNTDFDSFIEHYGAVRRPARNPPAWTPWNWPIDPTREGRLLSASKNETDNGTNQLIWTDTKLLTETITQSPVVAVPELLKVWEQVHQ